jgi:hypothetical protein
MPGTSWRVADLERELGALCDRPRTDTGRAAAPCLAGFAAARTLAAGPFKPRMLAEGPFRPHVAAARPFRPRMVAVGPGQLRGVACERRPRLP